MSTADIDYVGIFSEFSGKPKAVAGGPRPVKPIEDRCCDAGSSTVESAAAGMTCPRASEVGIDNSDKARSRRFIESPSKTRGTLER